MTDYQRQIARYNEFERTLRTVDGVSGVSHAEDYVPPHKSAGFTPYDCVVAFEDAHWGEGDIEALFDQQGLEYDCVVGVGPNDSCHEGEAIAFVSLVEFDE